MFKTLFNVEKLSSIVLLLFFSSFMQANSFTGPTTLAIGSTATYTASQSASNYYWSATGGISIVGSNTGISVNVKMVSKCGSLYLVAYGTNSTQNYCYNTQICPPPVPLACALNSGVINDVLCVTNIHPYWRLQMDGYTGQNVTYSWTADHFNIISGQNSSYMIGNPNDNGGYGFTIYCKITKPCSSGGTISRTFYYRSNSTKACGQGVTGEYFGGGGADPINAKTSNVVHPEMVDVNALSSFPNPFEKEVKITYQVPSDRATVDVSIYNHLGQAVLNPIQGKVADSGAYEIVVNGNDLKKKGLYFVKLSINGEVIKTHKIYFN